ncbi:UNVERIFIED_CONTAM: hypothetical protein Sangu_0612000 [Sesamum angustifolium]|uniref:Uncharacterized protein n=1 Tax=Sesamum angustifolium TaxID=2727405 RepID=A0AAW2QBG6_9LAMI
MRVYSEGGPLSSCKIQFDVRFETWEKSIGPQSLCCFYSSSLPYQYTTGKLSLCPDHHIHCLCHCRASLEALSFSSLLVTTAYTSSHLATAYITITVRNLRFHRMLLLTTLVIVTC